jgi:phosphoribosyl 1,2-cyclic phosphodiesterase
MGAYPWSLKQRILGDEGHLSNDAGAQAMIDMIGDKTKRIYLGHLSKENNMKTIAHQTCVSALKYADLGVHDQFEVYDTNPDKPTSLFTL